MKQYHWLLCVTTSCVWLRKITPLSNLTRASLLVEWKFTAKAELTAKSTNLEENAGKIKSVFVIGAALWAEKLWRRCLENCRSWKSTLGKLVVAVNLDAIWFEVWMNWKERKWRWRYLSSDVVILKSVRFSNPCLFKSNYVCLPNPVEGLLHYPQGLLPWPRDYHHCLLSWLNRKHWRLVIAFNYLTSLNGLALIFLSCINKGCMYVWVYVCMGALNLLGLLNEW